MPVKNFYSKIKERIKRMDELFHVELYLTEPKTSETGNMEISIF